MKKGSARKAHNNLESQFIQDCAEAFRKANYAQARKIAQRGLKSFPKSLPLLSDYASSIGDDEKGKSEKQRKLNHKKANGILKPLLRRLRGQPINVQSQIRNEYYWFSAQPLKQYKLGVDLVAKGHKSSYYSQGVGSVMLAQKFKKANNPKKVTKWALAAEKAWNSYLKHLPSYYNAYCWYARALGLLEKFDQMEKALMNASRISGKPNKYFEFEEIRKQFKYRSKSTT